jgi:hypothetical protein
MALGIIPMIGTWRADKIDYSISIVIFRGMGRPSKPESQKAKHAGFTAYPQEIDAIHEVARAKRFKAPFDYVRSLIIKDDHPKARGKIVRPRKIPSATRDPLPSPHTLPQPPV